MSCFDVSHESKECFKCGKTLSLKEFYKHRHMKDGHLNKCIPCSKKDTLDHRNENLDRIRAYDRDRGNRQTPEYLMKYREENPEKYKAHCMINNAIRDGKMRRKPCEVCGSTDNIHAHHDDYNYPLEVRWLCAVHHRQHHTKGS